MEDLKEQGLGTVDEACEGAELGARTEGCEKEKKTKRIA